MRSHQVGSLVVDRREGWPRGAGRLLPRRQGTVTLFLLLGLGLFLSLLTLAVEGANLWSARQEAQTCADAAALAAVLALADDLLLTPNPEAGLIVRERAVKSARRVAELNPVAGLPYDLLAHPFHPDAGDLRFGHATPSGFQPAFGLGDLPDAVAVRVERSPARGQPIPLLLGRFSKLHGAEVRAAAWASLDRHIVGLRPTAATPVPVAPLAILSDPTRQDPASFEVQAELTGTDAWVFDRSLGQVIPLLDVPVGGWELAGIREVIVRVPLTELADAEADALAEPNGWLLRLGPAPGRLEQWQRGLTPVDLEQLGGALMVPASEPVFVPALGLSGGSAEYRAALAAVLLEIREAGAPRVWPLCRARPAAVGLGEAQLPITGFMAARLANVRVESSPFPHLELILEPCHLALNLAVADPGRPELEPNRYISKPRLR